jgi:hypothetical protein
MCRTPHITSLRKRGTRRITCVRGCVRKKKRGLQLLRRVPRILVFPLPPSLSLAAGCLTGLVLICVRSQVAEFVVSQVNPVAAAVGGSAVRVAN